MTGKSREIADIMHRRKIMITTYMCTGDKMERQQSQRDQVKVSNSSTMAYGEPEMEYESS